MRRAWSLVVGMLAVAGAAVPVGLSPSGAEPTPIGVITTTGVQPGGIVLSELGSCTFNFMFQGSDGSRYMGTAGHCIIGGGGASIGDEKGQEMVYPVGSGPVAQDENEKRVGEFAYAVLADPKDLALVRLDPGVEASPQMAHFGGPTGINDDTKAETVTLQYYGQGTGIGLVLPARSAEALDTMDPDGVQAYGLAAPGDSGSGVISDDGRAVGALVSIGTNPFGPIRVTRLRPQLARAEEMLGIKLELVTAPKL